VIVKLLRCCFCGREATPGLFVAMGNGRCRCKSADACKRRIRSPFFHCPVCGHTSHNPNDVREGYCGHCHDWTREIVED
jgi:hypothetical protein